MYIFILETERECPERDQGRESSGRLPAEHRAQAGLDPTTPETKYQDDQPTEPPRPGRNKKQLRSVFFTDFRTQNTVSPRKDNQ